MCECRRLLLNEGVFELNNETKTLAKFRNENNQTDYKM